MWFLKVFILFMHRLYLHRSIRLIVSILNGNMIPSQSGSGCNINEGVLPTSRKLQPHYQIQLSVIPKTPLCGAGGDLTPLQGIQLTYIKFHWQDNHVKLFGCLKSMELFFSWEYYQSSIFEFSRPFSQTNNLSIHKEVFDTNSLLVAMINQ